MLSPGVSHELARYRARAIEDLRYRYELSIPEDRSQPIDGRLVARFDLNTAERPLLLDFAQPSSSVGGVSVNGVAVSAETADEHIVLPAAALTPGPTEVTVDFVAGESSLNRHDDYLYTLFVPDRARFALPIFDQPDLKARVTLRLELPSEWQAVANGPEIGRTTAGERVIVELAETRPIASYVLAFAAGRFEIETAERGGRTFRLFHRETDRDSLARNLDSLFDLHATALSWLEEYTGIEYPFQKLDFVAVPAFQYGGMEHPGAIFYRDRNLFLDESATQSRILGRASLIAHETAHMWFGNLVTMEWFDDVWMKEVFANFMAAKIVHPTFPEVDHELRFLLSHYPAAYGVDRTAGANPVRQELENLNEAGSLYGAIVYQKAPVLMKHLELLMGEHAFREGLGRYLGAHRYANATWHDLIAFLDEGTEEDLADWSAVWVEEPGRPEVHAELSTATPAVGAQAGRAGPTISQLRLVQRDPWGRGRVWNQRLELLLGYRSGSSTLLPTQLRTTETVVAEAKGRSPPDFVLANGAGVGYGRFLLDEGSLRFLTESLPTLEEPRVRTVAWLSLWEEMLDQNLAPSDLIDLGLRLLETDLDELEIDRVLGSVEEAYWRYLDPEARAALAQQIEALLWNRLEAASRTTVKASYFAALRRVASTSQSLERLQQVWSGEVVLEGLPLAERDLTALAFELAVREVTEAEEILDRQAARIDNPDRRERFDFIRPALSADPEARDRFFESLLEPAQRAHEPWVLTALGFLHHPLHASRSERYLRPALEELEEIQRTGDIFFPLGWLRASLGGHSSESAAKTVRDFLDATPELQPRLRGKLLQAADPLFRAAAIVGGSTR